MLRILFYLLCCGDGFESGACDRDRERLFVRREPETEHVAARFARRQQLGQRLRHWGRRAARSLELQLRGSGPSEPGDRLPADTRTPPWSSGIFCTP